MPKLRVKSVRKVAGGARRVSGTFGKQGMASDLRFYTKHPEVLPGQGISDLSVDISSTGKVKVLKIHKQKAQKSYRGKSRS